MIEQIAGLPPGTLGFRASGQVTATDYERVVVPDIEAAFAVNRKLRLLYHIGPEFTGFEPGAMWEDAMLGFPALQAMPVAWVEPTDISQVMVFLASDESRYITGQFIACDAGGHLKV